MEKNTLGETIYHLRKKSGLTQEALADGICSPVSISRIENGKQMPSGKSRCKRRNKDKVFYR